MKSGDRLCCKKNFIFSKVKWITKGKTYEFLYNEDSFSWYIIDDQKEVNEYLISVLYDFFYTKQEYRKIKLKKLNESNLH